MPKPPETKHEYNIPKLNRIFAVSSGLLLVSLVLIVWLDWHWGSLPLLGTQADRQWKRYQIQYNELERVKALQDKHDAEIRAELRGLGKIAEQAKAAQEALANRAEELRRAEEKLRKATVELSFIARNYADAKAMLDQRKSEYDLELEHSGLNPDAPTVRQAGNVLRAQQARTNELALKMQEAERVQKDAEAQRNALVSDVNALNSQLEQLRTDAEALQRKIKLLSDPVAQKALAAPLIEFLASPLQNKQIQIERIKKDVKFALVPTVDRCTTCHVGADRSQSFFAVESLEGIGETPAEFTRENLKPLLDLAARRAESLKVMAPNDLSGASRAADSRSARSHSSLKAVTFADVREFVADAAEKKTIEALARRNYPVLTQREFEQLRSVLAREGVALLNHYESLPQPLKSHPRLDLFVGVDSPHPVEQFGCSVCHHGSDRDLDFSLVGHTPDRREKRAFVRDAAHGRWLEAGSYVHNPDEVKAVREMTQHEAWVTNYKWRHDNFNEWPMRPMKYIESSCLKCHVGQTEVAHAEKLNRGLRLVEQLGCWSCHKMKQIETYSTHKVAPGDTLAALAKTYDVNPADVRALNNLPTDELKVGRDILLPIRTLQKTGPNLTKIASKSDPDWVRKWLANPQAFRPDTLMPRFWGHGNTSDESVYHDPYLKTDTGKPLVIRTADRNNAEIAAITEYLFALSEKPSKPKSPEGDLTRGRQLVAQLGCFGCHVVGDKTPEVFVPEPPQDGEDEDEAEAREERNELRKKQVAARNKALAQTIRDLPEQFRRYRSHGPMLAGMGSKTDRDWLFAWLKDPKSYHPRTRMPNLRLSDQEAADIAAYLATLKHAPTDELQLVAPPPQVIRSLTIEYLETQFTHADAKARFEQGRYDDLIYDYFAPPDVAQYLRNPALASVRAQEIQKAIEEAQKLADRAKSAGDDALAARAKTALDAALRDRAQHESLTAQAEQARARIQALSADQKRDVYLGGRLIARYGCYACHDIKGFETAKPIGTELSDWGSKEIAKLDFGLLGPDRVPRNRYDYILQKLRDPRSFDEGKYATLKHPDVATKSPQEWLKMPLFNLSDEDREAIATVINGMTSEPVSPLEVRQLTKQEFDIERGRWLVKELNCAGCHLVEGKGWAIRTAGVPAESFHGNFRWQDIAKQGVIGEGLEPPMLSGAKSGELKQGARTQPEWLFNFLKEPTTGLIRPWLNSRMPTFGLTDAEANVLVRYFAYEAKDQFPYKSAPPKPSEEMLAAGKQFFESLQCARCHIVEGKAFGKPLSALSEAQLSQLAPDFRLTHDRLQRDWLIEKWLPNPAALVPGTRMPMFEYGPSLKASAPPLLGEDRQKQLEALVDYIRSLGDPARQPPAQKK
jgi:cytochrome c2/LysM repeat protein